MSSETHTLHREFASLFQTFSMKEAQKFELIKAAYEFGCFEKDSPHGGKIVMKFFESAKNLGYLEDGTPQDSHCREIKDSLVKLFDEKSDMDQGQIRDLMEAAYELGRYEGYNEKPQLGEQGMTLFNKARHLGKLDLGVPCLVANHPRLWERA